MIRTWTLEKHPPENLMKIIALIGVFAASLHVLYAQSVATIDPTGIALNQSFIWTANQAATNESLHVGFRWEIFLPAAPSQARLHLFAYTRYQLFVNGEYVGRGPNPAAGI